MKHYSTVHLSRAWLLLGWENCTPETYIILWTNVSPINSINFFKNIPNRILSLVNGSPRIVDREPPAWACDPKYPIYYKDEAKLKFLFAVQGWNRSSLGNLRRPQVAHTALWRPTGSFCAPDPQHSDSLLAFGLWSCCHWSWCLGIDWAQERLAPIKAKCGGLFALFWHVAVPRPSV